MARTAAGIVDPTMDPQIFKEELEELEDRWRAVDGEVRVPDGEVEADKASVRRRLVGLAFSGGGIRSATLNTGIVQSLHRHGVFDHVDYLSTVSGGGYLGSCISTLMRREGTSFPFPLDGPFGEGEGLVEPAVLTWIRNHSNYLAERGFIDYLRIAAVLVRGVLLNALVLLPWLLLLALALGLVYGPRMMQEYDFFALGENLDEGLADVRGMTGSGSAFVMTPVAALIALAYFLVFPVVTRLHKVVTYHRTTQHGSSSTVSGRDRYERSFAVALLAVAGVMAFEAVPFLIRWFHQYEAGEAREWLAAIACGSSVTAIGAAGPLLAKLESFQRQAAMLAIGLLGILLPLAVVLYVIEFLVYSSESFNLEPWHIGALPLLLIVLLVATLLIAWRAVGWQGARWMLGLLATILVIGGVGAGVWWAIEESGYSLSGPEQGWLLVLALAVQIWLFNWLSVDINLTSMNGFYRDRLASAYLVGEDQGGDVDIEEDVNLQDLRQPGSRAPYHLVNVALNLQGSRDPGIRERNSDFFIFSKRHVGGPRTGYCTSGDLEAVHPQMDLATAMAISAAAAAPNMGRNTTPLLVAVMTLFNIRLGYWIPHPGRLGEWAKQNPTPQVEAGGGAAELTAGYAKVASTLRGRFTWRVRPAAIFAEMLSLIDEEHRWVNLSDGGHLENLAAIELLRRRLKYVIIGDGEADPRVTLNGLATLIRTARIDLGVEITIDTSALHLDEAGKSGAHWAVGTIHYPEGEEGTLLYLKSSFTGDESPVVVEYRSRKPSFPHESTADQFFDEGQFEAYRDLGQHIADGLFDGSPPRSFAELEGWFAELRKRQDGSQSSAAGAG